MTVVPPKKLSAKARKEAVEKAIREQGWSHELALALAQQTGWSWRTLYRDREAVLDDLVNEEQEDLPRRRAAFLADLRALRNGAKNSSQFSPAARLMAMESQVLGLDRVPLPTVEDDDGPVDTSLEGVLAEVRRLRKRAMAGDSYVAAEKLLEREASLVESIRQRDEAKAAAEHSHLDEDGLVELVEQAAAGLPESVRARLRSALGGV